MIDPDKILNEVEFFFRFRTDKDLIHQEEVILRVERYYNATELIKQYSFQSKIAREEHTKKFECTDPTTRMDFLIAWHIIGKEGHYNKESIRNWMISKIISWMDKIESKPRLDKDDHNNLQNYAKRLYEYRELDKENSEIPDFSKFQFEQPIIMPNAQAIEYKLDPKRLDDKIQKWMKPKNNKETVLQDANLPKDGE